MKKITTHFSATLFFIFTTIFSSYAQLDIKTNLDNLLDKKPDISIEAGSDKFSLELTNGLIFKKWGEATIEDAQGNVTEIGVKRFGYNGILRANYYFNPKTTLDGWFVSPYARYRFQNIKFEQPVVNNRFAMGLMLGRKGMITDVIGYQVEAGFGYWITNKYKIRATKEETDILQDFAFLSDLFKKLDRLNIPINVTFFYRIGG